MVNLNAVFFSDTNSSRQKQLFCAIFFIFCTVVTLRIDSVYFAQTYFDGRDVTNFCVISYFSFFFFVSGTQLKKLMFVMVFLSYIGELIFCNLLKMYEYRTDTIPLYVPFGHAIVYASGYVFAHTDWATRNDKLLKKYFGIGFVILFLSVGIILSDMFSLIFGLCFFLILKRKKWQNLYYFIALCVIFIELVGTYNQCWSWFPKTFGLIPAINPPMGAVFFYAGGDVLLMKIVSYWKNGKKEKITPNLIDDQLVNWNTEKIKS